jgi:hypothetical protein
VVLEILSESDHDALAQGVKRLAAERGNDPNVVEAFAALMGHLESATPTPRLEALLLRRAERSMNADAEVRARAAKVQQDQAAEDEAALADAMTGVADRHRRWGRSE